ncbi:DUF58 domain-containing protein [Paludisphaera borealis]|uniref:DUF58 domain-containing protein n=1 Tax=Paludisphaera borealis TaxID=1387353 RepID=A0A1U7CKL6_9BACT|nr:DUF58 domain-containing protein [Paludisphaera borealis]APW59448.1 hypothetical protein BSF38_00871 [Paludisphaera borealis]
MSVDDKHRGPSSNSRARRIARGLVSALVPTERTILTWEGRFYGLAMAILLTAGVIQQINLILLVATFAAGPLVASLFSSRAMLKRLSVQRRSPGYVFSGDTLVIDYALENGRRRMAALALFIEDALVSVDRSVTGAALSPSVFFARVAARDRVRLRWQGPSPKRGKYRFRDLDLATRAPFGIVERRVTIPLPEQLVVYPKIGQLTRRWFQLQRQTSENRLGQRHDRSAQQEEYHGLRDYRAGDSSRWIHWRTSARRGELMVKEFEQQNEQDLAILIDPWLPRTKVSPLQREAVEQAISFAATICLETCRRQGRRLVLGWTGATPGVIQGQASVKLVHELLEQLAVLRYTNEGGLAELFDALPQATLRDALLIVVSTRPHNLVEEAERSTHLTAASARSLLGRAVTLNAAQGELNDLVQYAESNSRNLLEQRLSSAEAERLTSQEERRRGKYSGDGEVVVETLSGDGPPSPQNDRSNRL